VLDDSDRGGTDLHEALASGVDEGSDGERAAAAVGVGHGVSGSSGGERLDAQFVPVLRIQPIQMLATFQDLLPLATQLLRCYCCEPSFTEQIEAVPLMLRSSHARARV